MVYNMYLLILVPWTPLRTPLRTPSRTALGTAPGSVALPPMGSPRANNVFVKIIKSYINNNGKKRKGSKTN